MKAWLDQYQSDHPLQFELLMARVRQERRRLDALADGDDRPGDDVDRLLDEHPDRFDDDVEPFGHVIDDEQP